jgi:hypothetical protein
MTALPCKMDQHRLDMSNTEDTEQVVQLVTTRSDAEIAADLRKRLLQEVRPVLAIFDEAASYGPTIQ